jgi:putative restriction endonuclease
MSSFNAFELAAKAWPILTAAAEKQQSVTYGWLANTIGMSHHRPINLVLSEIQDYCLREKLPPLTILVESQGGGVGTGFIAWDADDIESGRQKVYAENWNSQLNPFTFALDGTTLDDLAAALAESKLSGKQAYARVKVRGMAQIIFRKALLHVYGRRCAFSNDGGELLMQAAHIVPWNECEADEKLDPRNGILLSVLHHRMFDLNWIQLSPDYRISVNRIEVEAYPLSPRQRENLAAIEGRQMRLPADSRHHPSPSYISRRYASTKLGYWSTVEN